MSDNSSKNAAVAAAIILVVVAATFLSMPRIVLSLGEYSPWFGYGAAIVFILGFFAIFWGRSWFQQRNRDGS